MDIGTLIVLFFVAAFFDAVTVMVIRQGNQQSSPVIFRALVAISIGFTLAFVFAAFVPGGDALAAVAITLSLAVLFASVAANDIRALLRCTVAVDAVWRGSLDQPTGEAVTLRYPTFSYTYQGRTYCARSVQSVSKRHARRMAEAGTCTIYLNPNHPATFITRKTVGLITLTELALAAAALGATLWIATSAWG